MKFMGLFKMSRNEFIKATGRLAGIAFLTLVGSIFLDSHSAAAFSLSPAIPTTAAPPLVIKDFTDHCDPNKSGWNVVQNEWVSPVGYPSAVVMSVPWNTAAVNLQLNYMTYRCKINVVPSTTLGSFIIESVTPTSLNYALKNYKDSMPYVATNTKGYRTGVLKTLTGTGVFSYAGPFTVSTTIVINTAGRGTISKTNGVHCSQVASEGDWITSSKFAFWPNLPNHCASSATPFSIKVNVGAQPPPASLTPLLPLLANTYLEPGKTYNFSPGSRNNSAVQSKSYTLNFSSNNPAQATGAYFSSVRPAQNSGSLAYPAGGVNITIAAGTADATVICFRTTLVPTGTDTVTTPFVEHCYPIYKVYKPVVIGNGSDVHAGSGVCGPSYTYSSGFVKGQGDSKGEYVVSANGSIAGFGSNGSSASTSTSITNYVPQTLCRPNLVNVASTFVSLHPIEVTPLGQGSYNLSTLYGLDVLNTGVIYINNGFGNVTITGGTVSRKLTIYAPGTITITGNIGLTSAVSARGDQPSLGLIAGNGININGAATQVDAYMFSDGAINTCFVAPCKNTLSVRGFLMAPTLQFRRLGPIP